jgi:hypothetical protein
VYADLAVELKAAVLSNTLRTALSTYVGNSAVAPNLALAGTPLEGYAGQAVGAANFPPGTVVVFLHTANNQLTVYVQGKTIPQLKGQCVKSLTELKRIAGLRVSKASASIMIPVDGTDLDILTGEESSWLRAFWQGLKEKLTSKVVPAAVSAVIAVIYFAPSETPVAAAIIALVATFVGVLAEAAHSAWTRQAWTWKESK